MLAIFEADEVSKCDMSRDSSDEQPSNMEDMSVTAAVLKLPRLRLPIDEQPENMEPMSVTFEVSNDERSREASEEQT